MIDAVVLALAIRAATPEVVVQKFAAAYVKQKETTGLLQTKASKTLEQYLSQGLLKYIADLRDCQDDWFRQQPKGSTDKPPLVDCCLLSGIPDGPPSQFTLGPLKTLDDGRVQVTVNYAMQYDRETLRWQDAYIVAKENGGWRIDDVLFGVDTNPTPKPLTAGMDAFCRDGKWVEESGEPR